MLLSCTETRVQWVYSPPTLRPLTGDRQDLLDKMGLRGGLPPTTGSCLMGRKTRGNTLINSNTEEVSNLDDELSKQGETLNDMLMSTKTGLIKATFIDPRRNIIAFFFYFGLIHQASQYLQLDRGKLKNCRESRNKTNSPKL